MKRISTQFISTSLAIICATLLAGCSDLFTTQNSEPFTAKEVMKRISENYGIDVELQTQRVVKTPPYAKMGYTLRSKKDNISFTATASVRSDPNFGWSCKVYSDTYQSVLMYHCRGSAQAFASDYTLRYVPIAAATDAARDAVYLNSPRQIDEAAALYFDLLERYNFPARGKARIDASYTVYYLPKEETDLTKAILLFTYVYGHDFVDTPEKLRIDLCGRWDDKWRSKKIPVLSNASASQAPSLRERLHAD